MASLSVLFDRTVDPKALAGALHERGPGEIWRGAPVTFAPLPRPEGTPPDAAPPGSAAPLAVDGFAIEVMLLPPPAPRALAEPATHAGWPEAEGIARRLVAEVRVRTLDGGEGDRPLGRLRALSRAASALLALPGAVALHDADGGTLVPAGEAIRRLATLESEVPPLDLWVGVRRFQLADAQGVFLDTLGMAQFGLPDLEAYAGDGAAAVLTADWLRNLRLYLVQQGAPFHHGDTLDGPDEEPWVAAEDGATVEPARPVLRFTPLARA